MKPEAMDVVYIVRPGDENEELRYSLRTVAANLPHRRVVIAGYTPDWVRNVYSIDVAQDGPKYLNAANNWRAAMADETVSENFIVFNDDFYVMQPVREIPTLHRGSLESVIGYYGKYPGPYISNMRRTRDVLEKLGFTDLKSYALHIPMVMNKTKRRIMDHVLAELGYEEHKVQMRTLYGNFWQIGGAEMADVKAFKREHNPQPSTFISSNDSSFYDGKIGVLIREKFNEKGPYEA